MLLRRLDIALLYFPDRVNRPGITSQVVARDGNAFIKVAGEGGAFSKITTTPNGSEMYVSDGAGKESRATADLGRARLQYWSKNSFGQIEVNDNEVAIRRDKMVNGVQARYDKFAFDDNGLTYKQADYDAAGNATNVRWTSLGDTGWLSNIELGAGWQMPPSNIGPWAPLRYRRMMGTVWVNGYLSKPAGSRVDETMCRLPEGFRPSRFFNFPGSGSINTDGHIACPEASTAVAVSFSFPVN